MNYLIHNKGRRDTMIIKWIPFRYFYTYLALVFAPLIIPPLCAVCAAICIPFFMLFACLETFKRYPFLIPIAWPLGTAGLYIALGLAIGLSPLAYFAYYLILLTLTCLLLFE